jgi:APA family basic amino acid/polyamine antiporter
VAELARKLGLADSVFLVIGAVFGSGIFLTSGIIAADLPSASLIWLVWILGGFLTLIGALTYAELGALFPGAGGSYIYLRKAYGPSVSFLYGWAFFWIIGGGGIAGIAMGFAEYFGALIPGLESSHILAEFSAGPLHLHLSTGHIIAVVSIVVLSGLNCLGIQSGAAFQNLMTIFRIAA